MISDRSVDSLIAGTRRLNVSDESEDDFQAKPLMFSAWVHPPTQQYLSPSLSLSSITRMLSSDLDIDIKTSDVARLRSNVGPFSIQKFDGKTPPEAKPNLLILILSLLRHHRDNCSRRAVTAAELLNALGTYDVIIPRNPLKSIMSSFKDEYWEVYACKPYPGSPLFIDRTKSYETNSGSIGMLFESRMTIDPRKYHRVYAISTCHVSDIRVALTGEIDCLDHNDACVELKTRPEGVRPDQNRQCDTWIQSKLAGVETVVTGSFTRRRYGPVFFSRENINRQSFSEFEATVEPSARNDTLKYGELVLAEALQKCTKVGVVYHLTGRRDVAVQVCEKGEMEFPITKSVVDRCVEAVLKQV